MISLVVFFSFVLGSCNNCSDKLVDFAVMAPLASLSTGFCDTGDSEINADAHCFRNDNVLIDSLGEFCIFSLLSNAAFFAVPPKSTALSRE